MGLPQVAGALSPRYKRRSGYLVGFGWNNKGQLGVGWEGELHQSVPLEIGIEDVEDVQNGNFMAGALLSSGDVVSWGASQYGQLGNGIGPTLPWAGAWEPFEELTFEYEPKGTKTKVKEAILHGSYAKGQVVFGVNTGLTWISRVNNNRNNPPPEEPVGNEFWETPTEAGVPAAKLVLRRLESEESEEPEYFPNNRHHALPCECPSLTGVQRLALVGVNGALLTNEGYLRLWGSNVYGLLGTGWQQVNGPQPLREEHPKLSGVRYLEEATTTVGSKRVTNVTLNTPNALDVTSPGRDEYSYIQEAKLSYENGTVLSGEPRILKGGPFTAGQVGHEVVRAEGTTFIAKGTTVTRYISSTAVEISKDAGATTGGKFSILYELFPPGTEVIAVSASGKNTDKHTTYEWVEFSKAALASVVGAHIGWRHTYLAPYWANQESNAQYPTWGVCPLGFAAKKVISMAQIRPLKVNPAFLVAEEGTGLVWVWGNNGAGQLPLPLPEQENNNQASCVPLEMLENPEEAYGPEHAKPIPLEVGEHGSVSGMADVGLALRITGISTFGNPVGEVLGWGANAYNELLHPQGTGEHSPNIITSSHTPIVLPGLEKGVRAISGGYASGLAIIDGVQEGEVYAWGSFAHGALGSYTGSFSASATAGSNTLTNVWLPATQTLYPGDPITGESSTGLYIVSGVTIETAALTGSERTVGSVQEREWTITLKKAVKTTGATSGTVMCYHISSEEEKSFTGNIVSYKGKLAIELATWPEDLVLGAKTELTDSLGKLPKGTTVKEIRTVEPHFIIELNGTPSGVATGDTFSFIGGVEILKPVRVGSFSKAFKIVADRTFFALCHGVGAETHTYAWGGNTYGQLGDGTNVDKFAPVELDLPEIVTLSTDEFDTFAITGQPPVTKNPLVPALAIEGEGEGATARVLTAKLLWGEPVTKWEIKYQFALTWEAKLQLEYLLVEITEQYEAEGRSEEELEAELNRVTEEAENTEEHLVKEGPFLKVEKRGAGVYGLIWIPQGNLTTLTASLSTFALYTSLPVEPLDVTLLAGAEIELVEGSNTQVWKLREEAAEGAKALPVVSQKPSHAFQSATTIVGPEPMTPRYNFSVAIKSVPGGFAEKTKVDTTALWPTPEG